MKRKTGWLILSCLMALSLVLASCAPTVTEEEVVTEEEEVVTEEEEEEEVVTEEKVALGPEVPKYGGKFTLAMETPLRGFDEAFVIPFGCYTLDLTHEPKTIADWAKGASGTGEISWQVMSNFRLDMQTGGVAESWEIDNETVTWHIRKGIRFQDKPPVNGREMDANDVVFTMKRLYETPGSYHNKNYPASKNMRPISIEATDKWTVVAKYPPGVFAEAYMLLSNVERVVPQEMVEKYGDLQDWKASCGTGPYMLVDYVPMSSISFERNPNYWMKDPLHPENTLPYIERVEWLILQDRSTRLAALRTAKLDYLTAESREAAESIAKTNPDIIQMNYLPTSGVNIFMRTDKPELPFGDIRVRRALAMAVDNEAIARDLYGGEAVILHAPISNFPEFKGMHIPLEELSKSTREQYEYHPDKARQLMAEAGYPDGFKIKILTWSKYVDICSIYQEYFRDIGVDMKIEVKEYTVYASQMYGRTHDEMIIAPISSNIPQRQVQYWAEDFNNLSMVDDPHLNEIIAKLLAEAWQWDRCVEINREEFTPYLLEQCWSLDTPTAYQYTFWWPWVQNYHGELSLGYYKRGSSFAPYIWIDQDMKKSMGH